MTEQEIELALIEKLGDLKYTYRPDIRDRSSLEQSFTFRDSVKKLAF